MYHCMGVIRILSAEAGAALGGKVANKEEQIYRRCFLPIPK
jgi:hypothetical protein